MSKQRLHVATATATAGEVRDGRRVVGRARGDTSGVRAGSHFNIGKGGSGGSGVSSTCSSVSISPIPIPAIAISPGDESSESEIETEPAKVFHRRVSTKRNINSSESIMHFLCNSSKNRKILAGELNSFQDQVYDDLMNLIVSLGNSGVIHGDFNEFNIMLGDDGKPVLIDFPQMMSTPHENAKYFFDRDVQCVRELFRCKYNYESEEYPQFSSLIRDDNLDKEVHCTGYGFTKQMEDYLLKVHFTFCVHLLFYLREYGMIDHSDDESEIEDKGKEAPQLAESTNEDINEYRHQLENEIKFK